MARFIALLTLIIQLGLAWSVPTCNYRGRHATTFTCTAGEEDHLLKRGLVSDSNRTTAVVLKDCRIIDVDLESFTDLPNVHAIDLSLNKLEILRLGVMDESVNVRRFNISYNKINNIPLGLFDKMINLEVFDVRGNRFKHFELGVFDPTTKLIYLDLSKNKIKGTTLSPYLLDQAARIETLDYSRNNMSGAAANLLNSLRALHYLNLDRCNLKDVPEFVIQDNLNTLKRLVLSTNDIETINNNGFNNLVGLEILDLTANRITSLHQDLFNPLTRLRSLYLRYNSLRVLSTGLFQNLKDLTNLDLSHNLLETVNEQIFHNLPRLERLNLSLNRLAYLPANFYKSLQKTGTNLSKFYFNDNPWQCACLRDILREVKAHKVVYNDNKYTGEKKVCAEPQGWELLCKRDPNTVGNVHKIFDDKD